MCCVLLEQWASLPFWDFLGGHTGLDIGGEDLSELASVPARLPAVDAHVEVLAVVGVGVAGVRLQGVGGLGGAREVHSLWGGRNNGSVGDVMLFKTIELNRC